MRAACDEIQCTRRGRTKLGGKSVVAHGVVLCQIPHPGNGITVVITHGQSRLAEHVHVIGALADIYRGFLHELVHRTVVISLLLRAVAVVLIASQRFRRLESQRRVLVGVLRQQSIVA